ncbi:MAG: hypothetical protein KBD53_05625 [Candidatus Omnitrophica bacterium]|nr:hypothetical protein [Candidatus Omnitrophota bacterium]
MLNQKNIKLKNNSYAGFGLFFLLIACSGCSTVLSYESIIQKADSVDISKGISEDDAVLIAQKHIILHGLDQNVSVRQIGAAKLMEDKNFWLITFNKTIDNKVGDRRHEIPQEIIIQVNRTTGKSVLFSK